MGSLLLSNLWSPANKGDLGIAEGLLLACVRSGFERRSCAGLSLLPVGHRDNDDLARTLSLPVVAGNPLTPRALVPQGPVDRVLGRLWPWRWEMATRAAGLAADPLAWARRNLPAWLVDMDGPWLVTGGAAFYANGAPGSAERVARITMVARVGAALGRRVVFGPQSLGPIGSGEDARALLSAMAGASALLFRESHSLEVARWLGLPAELCGLAPDAAWMLRPRESVSARVIASSLPAGDLVGISWRRAPGMAAGEAQARRLVAVVEGVRAMGLTPVLVAHVTGPTDGEDDLQPLRALAAGPLAGTPVIDCGGLDPGECIAVYSRFRAAIGVRFHFCLFCLLAGVPAVGLAYRSPKHVGTYADIGIGELAFGQDWKPEDVVAALVKVVGRGHEVAEIVEAYRERAVGDLVRALDERL